MRIYLSTIVRVENIESKQQNLWTFMGKIVGSSGAKSSNLQGQNSKKNLDLQGQLENRN
jgi:hypothetical protein